MLMFRLLTLAGAIKRAIGAPPVNIYSDVVVEDNPIAYWQYGTQTPASSSDAFDGVNGDSPNWNDWFHSIANTISAVPSILANKMHFECYYDASSYSYAKNDLRKYIGFVGDFDIEINFSNFTADSGMNAICWLIFDIDMGHWVGARRGAGLNQFVSNINGVGQQTYSRSSAYGGLRVVRTGSTVTTYRKDGGGAWTPMHSGVSWAYSDPESMAIGAWCDNAGTSGTLSFDIDSFTINSANAFGLRYARDSVGDAQQSSRLLNAGGTPIITTGITGNDNTLLFRNSHNMMLRSNAAALSNLFHSGASLEVWAKPSRLGNNIIVAKDAATALATDNYRGWGLQHMTDARKLRFYQRFDNGTIMSDGVWEADPALIIGAPYYTVVNYSAASYSNKPEYIINGVVVDVTEISSPAVDHAAADDSGAYFCVGDLDVSQGASAAIFSGVIDDTAVYGDALALSRARVHYLSSGNVNYNTTLQLMQPKAVMRLSDYDPHSASVGLLSHFGGVDNGTTFIDETGKAITPYGGAVTKTSIKKLGSASAYFDGVNDYLSLLNNTAWDFGAGDYTVEAWVYLTAFPTGGNWATIVSWHTSGSNIGWRLVVGETGMLHFSTDAGATNGFFTNAGVITLGKWHHVAAVGYNGASLGFVDGTLFGNRSSHSMGVANTPLRIGSTDGSNWFFAGYIDELRVTKGVARYTKNFTPSASNFPYPSNAGASDEISEVTGASGVYQNAPTRGLDRLVACDESSTSTGFNGSTQYVTLSQPALSAGISEFTVAAWVRPEALSGGTDRNIWYSGDDGEALLAQNSADKFRFGVKLSDGSWYNTTSSISIAPDTTYFVVGVWKKGVSCDLFVNGVSEDVIVAPDLFLEDPGASYGHFIARGPSTGYFQGRLQDVGIFEKALTADEVSYLFAVGSHVN